MIFFKKMDKLKRSFFTLHHFFFTEDKICFEMSVSDTEVGVLLFLLVQMFHCEKFFASIEIRIKYR